jgi:hypothetical protein
MFFHFRRHYKPIASENVKLYTNVFTSWTLLAFTIIQFSMWHSWNSFKIHVRSLVFFCRSSNNWWQLHGKSLIHERGVENFFAFFKCTSWILQSQRWMIFKRIFGWLCEFGSVLKYNWNLRDGHSSLPQLE